jgi:signal transduction histidine kinase
MASRIVHEIRNPLNAIRMQAAVIRAKLSEPNELNLRAAVEQLDRLETEILRIDELAKAFLHLGKPPVKHPEAIPIASFLREMAELVEPELKARELSCVLDAAPRLSETCCIHMDRRQLIEVVHNLVNNSINATDKGGRVILRIEIASEGRLAIEIEDSGRGIPDEIRSRIFEPFFSSAGGTGLGLAIVKHIIEMSGGTITVSSKVGAGTRFRIELPQVSCPDS